MELSWDNKAKKMVEIYYRVLSDLEKEGVNK